MSPAQFFVKYSAPLLALAILVGVSVFLDRSNPKNHIIKRLGEDYFSTDKTWLYEPQKLFDMLDKYDEADGHRGEYRQAHARFIYLDLIYPMIYAITGTIMLMSLLSALQAAPHTWLRYLAFLPVLIAVFDYLENLSLLWILRNYTAGSPPFGMARFSSAMTTSKLFLMYATAALFVVALVALVFKWLRPAGR